jgi:hypothetical protein
VHLASWPLFGLSYQPEMMDDDAEEEVRAVGRMIRRGNRCTQRKPTTVSFCPPNIPHDMTRARARAAAMGSQRNYYARGRMASSGMLRRVALVRTDNSEEFSASIIKVTRIGELGTTLAVTSNRRSVCLCIHRNVGSYKSHTA